MPIGVYQRTPEARRACAIARQLRKYDTSDLNPDQLELLKLEINRIRVKKLIAILDLGIKPKISRRAVIRT